MVVSFLSSLGSMGSVDVPRDCGGVGICDISLLLLTIFQCMWLLSKCYLRASFESGIFSRSHVCPTIQKVGLGDCGRFALKAPSSQEKS